MAEYRLGEIESKFAEIIWENQPLTSRQLADLALERLCWKRAALRMKRTDVQRFISRVMSRCICACSISVAPSRRSVRACEENPSL